MPMTFKGVKIEKREDIRRGARVTPRLTNPAEHFKNQGGSWFAVSHNNVPHSRGDAVKCGGIDLGDKGFNVQATELYGHMVEGAEYKRTADDRRQHIGVKRKFASAIIAKIPPPLARHIAKTYLPEKITPTKAAT
jgi:hypothetical protein